jgi:hypothetical protein
MCDDQSPLCVSTLLAIQIQILQNSEQQTTTIYLIPQQSQEFSFSVYKLLKIKPEEYQTFGKYPKPCPETSG